MSSIPLARIQQQLAKHEALLELTAKEVAKLKQDIAHTTQEVAILEQVNKFLASQIQQKVGETKHQLESLVNQGLEYVFGTGIRIVIESSFKNNKTQFTLNIKKDGVNEGRMDSFGGGVLAVIAVLLRVSAIIITKTERFIFFDESTNFVSAQYQPALGNFLKQICSQLDFTIVLISHQETINKSADHTYLADGDPREGITFRKITQQDD